MTWRDEQLFGFSVKNMNELIRVIKFGVNMVEIKLERFAESGFSLYNYKNGVFVPNIGKLLKLKKIVGSVKVNFHLPTETTLGLENETGFNMCVPEHQDVIIDRFIMFEKIFCIFGLGGLLAFHPPLTSENGEQLIDESEGITIANKGFYNLDRIRINNNHRTILAMENMTDIKTKAGYFGYLPRHFKSMLIDTRTIGLTIDTGHRRLAKGFRVRDFMALGIPIENYHFHGNEGEFNPDNWDDDLHLLPDEDNVLGFENYFRYFRRHRPPVVLEISHLEKYSDKELKNYLKIFKKQIA